MRIWLARKLAPEVFKEAEKFDYLSRRIEDLRTWCGYEFPLIDKAAQWAQRSTRVYYMPLDVYHKIIEQGRYNDVSVGGIDKFREEIRRERDAAAA